MGKIGLQHSRLRSQWRSKYQWMFVLMISSELQNVLLPNLVCWCSTISQSIVWKNRITAFRVKVTIKGQNVHVLSRYLLNWQIVCHQTLYCDASLGIWVSCKTVGLLISRSRSQQGFKWSKYDSFYYIYWAADPFATKLGLIVHYHKSKCPIEKKRLLSSLSLDLFTSGHGSRKLNIFSSNYS